MSAPRVALAATATPAELARARDAAQALAQAGDTALEDIGRGAAAALQRVEKGASLEVPLRARLATARAERMPRDVVGMLRDDGARTTFYPADEGIAPFDVDARAAERLPRGALLLARATRRKGDDNRTVFYRVDGDAPPRLRGAFTGVVDLVDGRAFVRDLVKTPPTFHPLPEHDPATGKAWVQGTVVAARIDEASATESHVVVEARLAEGGSARARSWTVAAGQRLDPTFPAAAIDEARAIAAQVRLDDPTLVDLTGEPFFAIDNHGSRDIDQAMRLERTADGGFKLQYALADMSAYVRPGMALWDEAMARGASFYIPGISVPMQPEEVCTGAVSLNAHAPRRALVLTVLLDAEGRVTHTSSAQAKIVSRSQLTYPGVSAHLERGAPIDADEHGQPVPPEVMAQLQTFRDLGTALRERARARGVVETERRELRIGLDGERFQLQDAQADLASKLNAELSIVANCAGAALLARPGIAGVRVPGIFRVHEAPGPEKLGALRRQLDTIIAMNGAPSMWRWRGDEPLARWVERLQSLPATPRERALSRVLQAQVAGIQVSSEFARTPGLHAGLMVEGYGRFTAPMREAVGLVSHATLVQLESLKRVAGLVGDAEPGLVPLWEHMLLGALVEPALLEDQRASLARDAAALAGLRGDALARAARAVLARARAAPPLSSAESGLADEAVDRALEAGNRARQKQREAEGASRKLLFDDLFLSDLGGVPEGDPARPAPVRQGIVTSVSPGKICVQLDDPDVELRITRDDLARGAGERFRLESDGAELACACDGLRERRLLVGSPIQVRATHHDGDKLHFTVVD